MKKYIGTKVVSATPAIRKGGKVYLPTDEIPKSMETVEEGYKVIYEDGYESWSPKDVFEKAYQCIEDGMSFGHAIEFLKSGHALQRKGWNGKGLMVFKQVPAHIDGTIIPKMQSLPQSAKDHIMKHTAFIDYTSQCLIYNSQTGRADSWVPSISDVFANDWEVVTD